MFWNKCGRLIYLTVFSFISCGPAHSEGFDEFFEGLDKRQQGEVFCPPLLTAEYDLFRDMGRDAPREIVFDCRAFSEPISGDLKATFFKKASASFGVRVLESRNKWGWNSQEGGMITISNPYASSLTSVTVEFFDGNCGSIKDPTYVRLSPSAPIEPSSTRIVRFDIKQMNPSGRNACFNIVDADVRPVADAPSKLAEAVSLARAGQYYESGVLMDLAIRSGATLALDDADQLHDDLRPAVRALPASKSIQNRDGYMLLSSLRPEEADYERRVERYQSASYKERLEILLLDVISRAPVVGFGQVANELSGSRTRAQRDASWNGFKDKHISIFGRVTDVKPGGALLNARIEMDLKGDNSAVCMVKNFLNDAARIVEIGDQITCTGTLSDYTLFLGELTLSVTEAEFTK